MDWNESRINKDIFYRIINDSNTLTIVLDEKLNLEYCNLRAVELLNINLSEEMGENITNLHSQWAESLISEIVDIKKITNEVFHIPDINIRKSDTKTLTIGMTIRKIEIKAGESLFVIVGQDITQRRQQEEANIIGERLRTIGEITSGIVHDVNSPLQFIHNNLTFIKASLSKNCSDDIEDLREALDESVKGLGQITSLTNALKNFVYPSDLIVESFNIRQLIEDSISISNGKWKKKIMIQTEIPDNLKEISSYPTEIMRVLINMIVNAAQAIEEAKQEPGLILIKAYDSGEEITIEIIDDGPGIPDSIKDRIFDPFFTTKPRGFGTGQGLAIADSIIRGKCKGKITLEDKSPNGSIFKITLPRLN